MNRLIRVLVLCLAAGAATPALAQFRFGGTPELLEPEKAFRFAARALDASSIEVSFTIADGYYMYRDKFRFALEGAADVRVGTAEVPRGIPYKDQFFGEMEIFRKQVRIRVPVERAAGEARSVRLAVTSQGYADAGVCYVPMESRASRRSCARPGSR